MRHSISTGQPNRSPKLSSDNGKRGRLFLKRSFYRCPFLATVTVALIIMLSGFFTPAMAGPALYFRTLTPPQLPEMSYSQCIAKAYRTITLRVAGNTKAKKSYALGSTSDITAVVTCSKVGSTTTATIMVTSPSNTKAKDLLPQLVGDMRTPNF